MSDQSTPTPETQDCRIAAIIDGKVVDVINCPERLGAILLSEPTFVDVKSLPNVQSGATYDATTGQFN